MYAVDASTGEQQWTFEEPVGPVDSSPTVVDGTAYVGAAQPGDSGRDPTLYALDGSTGEVDWTYTAPSEVLSSPVVSDGTVYVGGGDLHAVDARTGDRTWAFTDFDVDAPTGIVLLSPPTVSNGMVFVGTHGSQRRNVYAIDAETGELTWVTRSQSRRRSDGTDVAPTTFDGSLYFGADALYSLDTETGEIAWRFDGADGPVTAAPTVVASPEGGHSVGSRVSLGTLGHHHTFADRGPAEPDDPDTAPDGELTGTVTDIDGQPLADATVRIYDAAGDSDAVIARMTTDEDGTYAAGGLETDSGERPDDILLVARDGEWFRSVGIDNLREQLPLEYDIELDSQLLFGPEVAAADRPLSALTCWRRVVERRRQTVFLEAVNLASSGPRHEITADPADLTDGAFALTVLADDVWINFGSQSDVGGTVPGRVEIVGLDTSTDHAGLADWHPTRTGLPLYQVGGEVDAPFGRISTADADVADAIDEGFGTIAGIVPGISELLTWLDTIQWAFGERLESEAILGAETVTYPDPSDPSATQTRVDPNNHTMAQLAWRSDNRIPNANEGAVVMAAPLEFQYDDERTTQVTAEAEWTHQNAHVSFGASFDVGPVGTEEKNDD